MSHYSTLQCMSDVSECDCSNLEHVWSPVFIQTQSLAFSCVACGVNETRKKRKRLRWQAANNGCHCFDPAFLLAGACVCCVNACVSWGFRLRNTRNASDCVWMETGLETLLSAETRRWLFLYSFCRNSDNVDTVLSMNTSQYVKDSLTYTNWYSLVVQYQHYRCYDVTAVI